jgi:hypothetical protein
MQEPWTAAKRAASLLPVGAIISSRQWWAVVLLALVLVGAGCWMARYTDAEEFWSPIFAWKRSRSKPP